LSDVLVFRAHRLTKKHLDVFAVAQERVSPSNLFKSPYPAAGIKYTGAYRHAVAGYHLAGYDVVFPTNQQLTHLVIIKMSVVYNLSIPLHER